MIRKIHTLPALSDNFIYVLESDHGECALVDPGEASPALAFIESHGLKLSAILCTHHHHDHVDGILDLSKCEVWAAPGDFEKIKGANREVREGKTLELFGERIEVLAVPGHTSGQVSFYLPRLKALFTGDTLFSCGCGRMFEGTYPQYFASLQKYKNLPVDTQMYFGHEYTERNIAFTESIGLSSPKLETYKAKSAERRARGEFTTPSPLGLEFEINPFLTAKNVAEFQARREKRNAF